MRHCLLIASLLLAAPTLAADGDSAYQRGLEAFQQGDFETAAEAFEAAREAGRSGSGVAYNLGVSYYRLGQWQAADAAFARAAQDPEIEALATYNRGRVATRAGRTVAAKRFYRRARDRAETDELRNLAASALAATESAERRTGAQSGPLVLAELGAGYDADTGLQGDTDRADGNSRGDAFTEFLLYGDAPLLGDRDLGLRVDGSLSGVRHPDNSVDDFDSLQAGLTGHRQSGAWRQEAGVSLWSSRLDGDGLESGVQGRAGLHRSLSDDLSMDLRYRLASIDGGSDYPELDGIRQDVRARLFGDLGAWSWRAAYTLELNDRDDIQTADGSFSASPLRNELAGQLRRELGEAVGLRLYAGLRHSRFPGEEPVAGGREERRDLRVRLGGDLDYRLGGGLGLYGRLDWQDNNSEIDRYEYDRFRVGVGVSYLYR